MITPAFSLTATERVLPKLALDFTTASLDPRITFTRSGNTATVIDSSGNITPINANLPRFDFNPVTLACQGLLIEEARTNLCLYSEDFRNTATVGSTRPWVYASMTITADAAVAPDNQQTTDKYITNNGTALTSAIDEQTVTTAAATYTYSCFAKAAEFNRISLAFRDNASSANTASVIVSLVDGSITTAAATTGTFTGASATVATFKDGWYRVTLTCTTTGATAFRLRVSARDSVATTGDGTSGIYIWGAQLETGAFATSYIPTTTTALTRSSDFASITGANFSSWYNQSEGTFVSQATFNGNTAVFQRYAIAVSDGTASNRITSTIASGSATRCLINAGGVLQADIYNTVTSTFNTPIKTALAYKANDVAISCNAGTVQTDNTVTIPTVNAAYIGGAENGAAGVQLNGTVAKIYYYPQRLTNAELQAFSK